MKHFVYLIVDLGCLLVPLLFSFHSKRTFYKEWKYFFPANAIVAIVFLIWDYFFTIEGVWGFNPDYLCGIYLFNLPLEEILFFVCIPYACIFSHFVLPYLLPSFSFLKVQRVFFPILTIISLVLCFIFYDKIYTLSTFSLLFIYLVIRWFWGDRFGRKHDLLSYLCIFPFFLISNGILTGTGLENPIVWYNESEIIGLRIFSIPVEDTCYGLLLILLNIELYAYLRGRSIYGISKSL